MKYASILPFVINGLYCKVRLVPLCRVLADPVTNCYLYTKENNCTMTIRAERYYRFSNISRYFESIDIAIFCY